MQRYVDWPEDGLTIDFVLESDCGQLGETVRRFRQGRLGMNIGNTVTLDDAATAFNSFNSTNRVKGKMIVHVRP